MCLKCLPIVKSNQADKMLNYNPPQQLLKKSLLEKDIEKADNQNIF